MLNITLNADYLITVSPLLWCLPSGQQMEYIRYAQPLKDVPSSCISSGRLLGDDLTHQHSHVAWILMIFLILFDVKLSSFVCFHHPGRLVLKCFQRSCFLCSFQGTCIRQSRQLLSAPFLLFLPLIFLTPLNVCPQMKQAIWQPATAAFWSFLPGTVQ